MSLLPCARASTLLGCFAVATDSRGSDLSPNITVTDITCPEPTDTDCLSCTLASLILGSCPAGQHVFRYSVTDADGNTASATATFIVTNVRGLAQMLTCFGIFVMCVCWLSEACFAWHSAHSKFVKVRCRKFHDRALYRASTLNRVSRNTPS